VATPLTLFTGCFLSSLVVGRSICSSGMIWLSKPWMTALTVFLTFRVPCTCTANSSRAYSLSWSRADRDEQTNKTSQWWNLHHSFHIEVAYYQPKAKVCIFIKISLADKKNPSPPSAFQDIAMPIDQCVCASVVGGRVIP
jgi:hypothetical protein